MGKKGNVAGKRPAASEDAHGTEVARRGTGEATLLWEETREVVVGKELGRGGGGEVLGLVRPGGGPVCRSMLGAEARRAEKRVGVCYKREDRRSMRRGGREHKLWQRWWW